MQIDKTGELKFASLQGETAKRLLGPGVESRDVNTVVYLKEGQKYERSTAILSILSDVAGAWRTARVFLFVPKLIRDFIYRLVATNRYRIFGKRDSCRMPNAEERERLLP